MNNYLFFYVSTRVFIVISILHDLDTVLIDAQMLAETDFHLFLVLGMTLG